MESKRGKLLVVSGPSGAGKTSICNEVLAQVPDSYWSVSVTTRARRGEEQDGREYQFIDQPTYRRMIEAGDLLENAIYLGEGYGTPLRPVEDALAAGRLVVMEIDVQGAAQVAAKMPESVRIFVLPPTMETLKARLEGRATESEALQNRRLAEADGEIGFAKRSGVYQHFITNDILQDSVNRVLQILNLETPPA